MKWPSWVDDYPGLEERLYKLAKILSLSRNGTSFMANPDDELYMSHSDIAQEAAKLKSALGDVIIRCVKLNASSISREYLPNCSVILENNDSRLATDSSSISWLFKVERLIKENLDCIESKHHDRSGAPIKDVDQLVIKQMVIDAVDSGLELKNNNANKYRQLFCALYRNADRDEPSKSMLIGIKRDVKKKREKT